MSQSPKGVSIKTTYAVTKICFTLFQIFLFFQGEGKCEFEALFRLYLLHAFFIINVEGF